MPHLVISISGHGFGHVAQTAPVLNLLHSRMPQLRLTVRSAVPLAHLRSRIHAPFTHLSSEGDIGMAMSSALDVLVEDSRAAYRVFHADWDARVAAEAGLLRELGADMVLSNVGYLPLAGAQHAGIPNAALCSLNWADIYRHYCGGNTIAAQIQACYAHADVFLRITPGMAMADLPNLIPVAPIAEAGTNRRDELNRRLPIERWPRIAGVRYLVQQSWQACPEPGRRTAHPNAIAFESLQMHFGDLLASSDALICKPGYGSFAEAACSGVPLLYVNRPDWPESPALVEWLQQHGVCREVTRERLERGDIAQDLSALWAAPPAAPPIPDGAAQVSDWLARKFSAFLCDEVQQ